MPIIKCMHLLNLHFWTFLKLLPRFLWTVINKYVSMNINFGVFCIETLLIISLHFLAQAGPEQGSFAICISQ